MPSLAKHALLALLFLALCPAGTAFAGTNNIGLQTIPLKMINNSGKGGDFYVYITGQAASNNLWYYVSATNGDVTEVPDNLPLSSLSLNLGKAGKTTIQLPQLVGLRIYVSLGQPILVNSSPGGVPSSPAGWVTSDPNFDTLFDWTEYTWIDVGSGNTSFGGNATQVDMFGIAMLIEMKGFQADFTTPVTLKSGFSASNARKTIFKKLSKAGKPWSKLQMRDSKNNVTRLVAPYHGMDLGVFPEDELKSYIKQVWKTYEKKTLKASTSGIDFKGTVTGSNLVFQQVGGSATFSFPKPDSMTVYTGGIVPVPTPSDPDTNTYALAIAAQLQGAFLRSTLLVSANLDSCKTSQFYENEPVDEYAKAIHSKAYKGLAYAFGYDDTCAQSSYIALYNPTGMTITLQPF